MPKKKKGVFAALSETSIGIAGLSVVTGVTAGVAAKAPAGTPSLTGATQTVAGFAPIGATVAGGKSVLKGLKGYKTKKQTKKPKFQKKLRKQVGFY